MNRNAINLADKLRKFNVEHRTSAEKETHILLIEPSGAPNTGNLSTAAIVERI